MCVGAASSLLSWGASTVKNRSGVVRTGYNGLDAGGGRNRKYTWNSDEVGF
jgi:hypothetical protein